MGAYRSAPADASESTERVAIEERRTGPSTTYQTRAADGEVDPQIGTGGAPAHTAFTNSQTWVTLAELSMDK